MLRETDPKTGTSGSGISGSRGRKGEPDANLRSFQKTSPERERVTQLIGRCRNRDISDDRSAGVGRRRCPPFDADRHSDPHCLQQTAVAVVPAWRCRNRISHREEEILYTK